MYCIVHLPPEHLPKAFAEMFRVLHSGGVLALTFHVGTEVIRAENFLDSGAALDEGLCELMLKPQGMRPGRFDFAGLRHAGADRVDEAAAFTPVGGLNRPDSD